jgi:hypothetical protein
MTDKEIPYGISLEPQFEGTVHGYDDTKGVTGYFYLSGLETKEIFNNVFVESFEFTVMIFVSYKKWCDPIKLFYSVALELTNTMRLHYGAKNVVVEAEQYQNYLYGEIVSITIQIPASC